MKKVLLSTTSLVAATLLFTGCMGNKLNVAEYTQKFRQSAVIPEVCEAQYNIGTPKVAVVDFTNNSTFGKAEVSGYNSDRKRVGVAGVGVSHGGIVGVSASNTKFQSERTNRSIDAKIEKSLASSVEAMLAKMGGADVYSRSDMEKILAEQKFQDSGLADDATLVNMGKLAGVRYIVTGSLDNVSQKYRGNAGAGRAVSKATQDSDNMWVKLAGAAVALGTSMTDGMIITAKLNLKILDVETGKIVFSETFEDTHNIGKIKTPTYDQIVGGIKQVAVTSLESAEGELSEYFKVRGYVKQVRGKKDDRIAQISVGKNFNVKENQEFNLVQFEEGTDPRTGEKSCEMYTLPVTLKATDQIRGNATWTTVEGENLSNLKLQMLVERKAVGGGSLF